MTEPQTDRTTCIRAKKVAPAPAPSRTNRGGGLHGPQTLLSFHNVLRFLTAISRDFALYEHCTAYSVITSLLFDFFLMRFMK